MQNKTRWTLTAIFLVVLVITGALFWILTERIGAQATAEQIDAALADTEHRAFDTISASSANIDKVADAISHLADQTNHQDPNTQWAMLQTLEFVPELSGVFLANSSGEFQYIFRSEDGFGIKSITKLSSGEREVRFVDLDANGVQTRTWLDAEDTYDPRIRPWYQAAVDRPGDPIWTDPYLFFTSQEPGITRAQAAPESTPDWVIGVDVELISLVSLVDDLSTRNSGEVFLFDGDHTALTRLGLVDLTSPPTDQDTRLRATLDAGAGDGEEGEERIEYEIDGQPHTARFTPVSLGRGNWSLVTDIARADVATPISGLVRGLQLLALGTTTLAAVALLLLFGPATSPIKRLERDANFDSLTALPNRRAILQRGATECAIGNRFTVGMIDVDKFKHINDTYGHSVGDEVLRGLALRLVASGSEVGRLGGEEFVVLLGARSPTAASAAANDLRKSIDAQPIMTTAGPISVTISVGIASHEDGEAFTDVLKRADNALLEAKLNGRNRVQSADPRSLTVTA